MWKKYTNSSRILTLTSWQERSASGPAQTKAPFVGTRLPFCCTQSPRPWEAPAGHDGTRMDPLARGLWSREMKEGQLFKEFFFAYTGVRVRKFEQNNLIVGHGVREGVDGALKKTQRYKEKASILHRRRKIYLSAHRGHSKAPLAPALGCNYPRHNHYNCHHCNYNSDRRNMADRSRHNRAALAARIGHNLWDNTAQRPLRHNNTRVLGHLCTCYWGRTQRPHRNCEDLLYSAKWGKRCYY